jgi:O-antigen/teichoic acid export membrane protein
MTYISGEAAIAASGDQQSTSPATNGAGATEALFMPALILMAGRLVGFVAAFAIPMVLARVFDLAEFGTYKQLFLVFGTMFGIAQLGMAESLYYFLPFETRQRGAYVLNTLLVLAAAGALALGLLWLWRQDVGRLLNNPGLTQYLPMIGFYLLFTLLAVVLEIVMTIRRQHRAASVTYALTDLSRAIFFVAPVLLFADLRWLLTGAIASAVLRCAATWMYVRREFVGELRVNGAALRKHLRYAIPFSLAGLIEIAQLNFHMYAVSWYFDTATFAIYAVGCLQIPLMDFMMTSTCNVMMVNMREKSLAGDHEAVISIWLDSVRKLALVFCPLVALLLLTAPELIVLLFTDAYAGSIPIFMVWTLSMLFATLLTDGALRVFAQTRFLIVQNLVRLALIAALIQFFLQQFGLSGAVLVTLLATAVAKILALWRIRAVMGVSLRRLLPWTQLALTLLLAMAAMAPVMLIKATLDIPDLPQLVISGTLYCLSYYLLLRWYGPMQADEKRMLAQWLQQPIARLRAALNF